MNGYPNYNFHGSPTSGFNSGFPNLDGNYGDPQNMHFTHNQNATFNFYIGNGAPPPPPPPATSQNSPLLSHSLTPSYQAGRSPMNAMNMERSWHLDLDPHCHPHYHIPMMGRFHVHPGRDPHPNANSHRCLNSREQQDIVFVMAPEQQGENLGHQSFNPNHQVPLPQQSFGTTQHHGGSLCPQFNGATHEYGGNRPTYVFRVNPRFTNSNISSGASSPFQSLSATTPPPQETDELIIEELSQRSLQSHQNSQSQRSFSNSQN